MWHWLGKPSSSIAMAGSASISGCSANWKAEEAILLFIDCWVAANKVYLVWLWRNLLPGERIFMPAAPFYYC